MKAWGLLAVAVLGLSGCLVDLYGGDPRLQIDNTSRFPVREVGIGSYDRPPWKWVFDPVVKPGQTSEVLNLPVAGELRLWIHIVDSTTLLDTVLTSTANVEVGGFHLLTVSGHVRSNLSTSH